MPSDPESTTRSGTGDSLAASRADSTVPDICDDRCTDTTASQPRSAAAVYACSSVAGPGRDVVTGCHERSASATMPGDAPEPSSYDVPPMTTCSGTTSMPCSRTSSAGR